MTPTENTGDYISSLFGPEDEALRQSRAEAQRAGLPDIAIDPAEGPLLQILARMVNAQKIVEIGTLGGYSGVWLARALPENGRLYTLEASPKHASVARTTFERAKVTDRVTIIEGPALDNLPSLLPQGPFDMVFIDADKPSYPAYLTWACEALRPGGIVAAHNALRGGRVLRPETETDRAMAEFNQLLAQEPRLQSTIIDMGDGLAVGVKKTANHSRANP